MRRGCAVALRDIGGWGQDYPRAPGACELERIAGTAAYGLAPFVRGLPGNRKDRDRYNRISPVLSGSVPPSLRTLKGMSDYPRSPGVCSPSGSPPWWVGGLSPFSRGLPKYFSALVGSFTFSWTVVHLLRSGVTEFSDCVPYGQVGDVLQGHGLAVGLAAVSIVVYNGLLWM